MTPPSGTVPLPDGTTRRDAAEGKGRSRFAFFLPSFGGGGAELAMVRLANGLAAGGHSVAFRVFSVDGPWGKILDPRIDCRELVAGTRIAGLFAGLGRRPLDLLRSTLPSLPRFLRLVPAIRRDLAGSPPDRIVASLHSTAFATILAADALGIADRVHVWEQNAPLREGSNEAPRDRRGRRIGAFYARAGRIHAVSRAVQRDLVGALGLPDSLVGVLDNPGCPADADERAALPVDHAFFTDARVPVILGVGRLTEQKDFATLIEAFRLLRDRRAARLLILGEGPLRPDLEARIRRIGLEADIALPGFVADPLPFMARAGAFVLSSRFEGFGLVLVEALAVGCPVVATRCPGAPEEILRDGELGALVPPGDPEAMSRAIEATLDTPVAKERLRTRARDFSLENCRRIFLDELDLTIRTGPGSRAS